MPGDALAYPFAHPARGPSPLGPLAAKIVVGLLVAIGVAVVAGAALLWPSQQKVDIPLPFQNAAGGAVTTEAGPRAVQRPGGLRRPVDGRRC